MMKIPKYIFVLFLVPGFAYANVDLYKDSAPSREDLSFIELNRMLQSGKFMNIEALLSHVSKTKPEYMEHYTLGFASRSLHESSKSHPRAVVYGKKGNFVIAFNGHPGQKNYDMLETMEFNQKSKTFEFRSIQFGDSSQLPAGSLPVVSPIGGDNGRCLRCHSNARPLWDSYPYWPGYYGGLDDTPFRSSVRRTPLIGEAPPVFESQWYQFESEGLKQGRYRFLKERTESILAPGAGVSPNLDFTILLGQLNAQRVVKLIKDNVPASARWAYLHAAMCSYWKKSDLKKMSEGPTALPIYKVLDKQLDIIAARGLEAETVRLSRLITEFQYDQNEVRNKLLGGWPNTSFEENWASLPFTDLLKLRIKKDNPSVLSYDGDMTYSYRGMAAISMEYWPETKPETWSTTIFSKGGQQHHAGTRDERTWLQQALLKEFFTAREIKTLLTKRNELPYLFCEELESLPEVRSSLPAF